MHNKPKYSFFKNWRYAVDGLITAIKTESSFKLELFFSIFIVIGIISIDTSLTNKIILLITGILVLIVELINSAIENVVDLCTKEIHPLAKNAKDIGSTAVMFTISLHIVCWCLILIF
ncbi:diacylglycerol kinase [Aliarcobacter cryaerophilus]|uniref:Diacylglycerol kinase n=1 Tax=Aliarcobacter cryaerophilus TaxID=28198 RepID=A0A2S9SKU2_9BACT|nr:diacylglycerol kinase [Aliarcobacter cryaerophilus]MCT7493200.1 diacylglycerol kinase [Aliarcobacter cryaerophilus]PRM87211.1 diacylglycerol kinase [Aliarcobacter cryaerophilus]